jgi:outer membrane protein assembly factor BamA
MAIALLCICGPVFKFAFAEAPAVGAASRSLVLEAIETVGNDRTSHQTVLLYLPLRAGDSVDQTVLLSAVEQLRQSGLFAAVDFYTRPGSERGRVVLVLEVEEKGLEVRFGTGYSDLSGWYLIPAELALDNRLGRGEKINLQLKLGYRYSGLVFAFDEPRLGDGAGSWGFQGSVLGTDRVYFIEGIEYRHRVQSSAFDVHLGRRLSTIWTGELGMRFERVDVDSFATVHATDELRNVESGDRLEWPDLPAEIARAAGERTRSVARLELRLDSRSGRSTVGSPASGFWGRVRLEGFLQGDNSFGGVSLDLRRYQSLLGGALAARIRAGAVGSDAAFHDRHYLGGLYSVRGFPSQSLSAPGGDTHYWSASCEYRAALVGHRANPRLAGVLFLDAGDSWTGGRPTLRDAAFSAGYGLRLRVAWLGWLGLDFALPLSDSPVDDAFQAHASIGWTF